MAYSCALVYFKQKSNFTHHVSDLLLFLNVLFCFGGLVCMCVHVYMCVLCMCALSGRQA